MKNEGITQLYIFYLLLNNMSNQKNRLTIKVDNIK